MTDKKTLRHGWSVWWNNVPENMHYPEGLEHYKSFLGIRLGVASSAAHVDERYRLLCGPYGATLVKAYFAKRK